MPKILQLTITLLICFLFSCKQKKSISFKNDVTQPLNKVIPGSDFRNIFNVWHYYKKVSKNRGIYYLVASHYLVDKCVMDTIVSIEFKIADELYPDYTSKTNDYVCPYRLKTRYVADGAVYISPIAQGLNDDIIYIYRAPDDTRVRGGDPSYSIFCLLENWNHYEQRGQYKDGLRVGEFSFKKFNIADDWREALLGIDLRNLDFAGEIIKLNFENGYREGQGEELYYKHNEQNNSWDLEKKKLIQYKLGYPYTSCELSASGDTLSRETYKYIAVRRGTEAERAYMPPKNEKGDTIFQKVIINPERKLYDVDKRLIKLTELEE